MRDWYFTFGCGHEFDGCYVVIRNIDFMGARMRMVSKYGIAWSGQYDTTIWNELGLANKMELLEELK